MDQGATSKPPVWRFGAWLFGTTLLISVPLWGLPLLDGFAWIAWMTVIGLLAFGFTVPHGLARLRGAPAYIPDPTPVRPGVSALTYIAFLVLYRLPVHIGDAFFTLIWDRIVKIRGREEVASPPHTPSELRAEAANFRAQAAEYRAQAADFRAEEADQTGSLGPLTPGT